MLAEVPGCVLHAGGDAGGLLTPSELATLDAALARLIPSDDGEPGAREARAIRYVERALEGAHSGHVAAYRRGLRDLDELALARFGAAFAALADRSQDAVLRDAERAHTGFFELMRSHACSGTRAGAATLRARAGGCSATRARAR